MTTFVDTSAFLAVLDADDLHHKRAKKVWGDLIASGDPLTTSSYVLLETLALLQHRIGLEAVRSFQGDVVPVLQIEWVDAETHATGMAALLAAAQRRLSLVDCVSFHLIRRAAIPQAFTLDRHFRVQGFACVP